MKKKVFYLLLTLCAIFAFIFALSLVSSAAVSDEGMLPFEDVKTDAWYGDAAEFAYSNGIINGMNDYTFAPNGTLTRAQFVTMLANIENADLSAYSTNQFTDVKPSHWYSGAVAWAYERGIVSGTSDTAFSPNMQINRQTIARIMALYMQSKGYSVEVNANILDKFTDKNSIASWAAEEMKYIVSAGIISGMTENTVAPLGVVTRAQAARILMLFMKDYYYGECEHSFTNADCTNGSVCSKCGMADSLPAGHSLPDSYNCTNGGKCTVCNADVAPSNILHDFAAATCGKPRTCKRCSATRGEPTGKHDWWAATCTNPKMCKVCYKTEGSKTAHKWVAATCKAPKTCSLCKATEGGVGAHNYAAANCTTAQKCKVCGVTNGKALGHSFSAKNNCSRCGKSSPYTDLVYALKTKGEYDRETNMYSHYATYTQNNVGYAVMIAYDATEGVLGLIQTTVLSNGDVDFTSIIISGVSNTYRLEYTYIASDGDVLFDGICYIDPAKVTSTTVPSFYSYEGNSSDLSTARSNVAWEMINILDRANSIIDDICGVKVADFGFVNF